MSFTDLNDRVKIDNPQQLEGNASENNAASIPPLSTANNLNVTADIHESGGLQRQSVNVNSSTEACIANRNTTIDNMASFDSLESVNDRPEKINVITEKNASNTLMPTDNGPAHATEQVALQENVELNLQNGAAGFLEKYDTNLIMTNEQRQLNQISEDISDTTEANIPKLMNIATEDNKTTNLSFDCTQDNRTTTYSMDRTKCEKEITKMSNACAVTVVDDVDNVDTSQHDTINRFDEPGKLNYVFK